jgi:hypothetical protein
LPPFDLIAFSSPALFESLSTTPFNTGENLSLKPQAKYLSGYLKYIKTKTIILENEYIDHDYLDDYSQFYAKCFEEFPRLCKRLHFFSTEFSKRDFLRMLSGKPGSLAEDKFRASYLGFSVVRPLPEAVIGRTVLKTYPPDNRRRYYTARRSYPVNLFGIDLTIDSLAFQEQDKALAACATVALWSCFHKANDLFKTPVPTPAAITRSANRLLNHRPVPSRGLDVGQICSAIRYFGLEPEVIEPTKEKPLASLIYAHLRFGNPVLLGVEVPPFGPHAITLVGYSLLGQRHLESEVLTTSGGIPMVGRRIDEFYAHDDQVGPFSRLKVVSTERGKLKKAREARESESAIIFQGEYKYNGQVVPMWPYVVIIPTYPKIRLGFTSVYKLVTKISRLFETVGSMFVRKFEKSNFEWDVHIVSGNALKQKIRGHQRLPERDLIRALTEPHPRYAWRILLSFSGNRILELLADTTAMEKSEPIYGLAWYDSGWKQILKHGITRDERIKSIAQESLGRRLFKKFEASFEDA